MKICYIAIIPLLFILSCAASKTLTEGIWSGTLSPENHPDQKTEIGYEVSYKGENLFIEIIGPGGMNIPTSNASFRNDQVYFEFVEPEEGVHLKCRLLKTDSSTFVGLCSDTQGKSAEFRMFR